MKPGPIIAMVLLPILGLWLIWNRPNPMGQVALHSGAQTQHLRVANERGVVEVLDNKDGTHKFWIHMPGQDSAQELNDDGFIRLFGERAHRQLTSSGQNPLFELLNITGWASMIWIAIGFGGQAVFTSRFIIQWIVSERKRESVIPPIFWWCSLTGAVFLFAYFVWRRDIVGVLGQSTGVVIYARNLRLIQKHNRRAASGASSPMAAPATMTDTSEQTPSDEKPGS